MEFGEGGGKNLKIYVWWVEPFIKSMEGGGKGGKNVWVGGGGVVILCEGEHRPLGRTALGPVGLNTIMC